MVRRTGFRIQDSGFRVQGPRVRFQESAFRIRSSSFALALLCGFFCSSLVTRHSSLPFAQQPQAQQGQPLSALNAKYVNGVAPGYWPTNGTGLTLNLSAGSSVCGNSPVPYAGGTLSMTASATNYVFLDMTNNCTPAFASGRSSFPATGIPLAIVTTSASAITAISDVRSWFAARPVVDPGGQVYNVKSFGAAGDGVTDDTAAIQVGLNQVCGNPGVTHGSGNLFFPLGTYKITQTLYCYESYAPRISGSAGNFQSGTSSVIQWYGASGGTMMVLMGFRNAVIENLDFDCRNIAQYGVVLSSTNVINTTLGTAVTSPGTVTVTPGSMTDIAAPTGQLPGTTLNVDTGSNFEVVFVTATTSSTFTATFTKTHLATAPVGNSWDTGVVLFQNVSVSNANGTYSANWLVGNNTNPDTVDVPGIHWIHCYAVGGSSTYAGVLFDSTGGGGNVQNFSWKHGWFTGLQYGIDFSQATGYLDVSDTNFEGDTVADFLVRNANYTRIRISSVLTELGTGATFIAQDGGAASAGSLELSGSDINGSPSNDFIMGWSGALVLIGNDFYNSRTSSSVPKISTGIPLFSGSLVNGGITAIGNTFVGVASGYPPFYDSGLNNVLLPTYYGNQPVAAYCMNNYGINPSTGANAKLNDYSAVGVLTDESQSTVATTGVLRGGNTSTLLAWMNNAGNGNITVSKDSLDVIRFGGAIGLGTGTAINAMNLYSTASISPTAVTASSCSDQTFTVSGLLATDRVSSIAPPSALGNLSLNGYASASNTVLLHFCNPSASSVTPPAGVYSFLAVH